MMVYVIVFYSIVQWKMEREDFQNETNLKNDLNSGDGNDCV